jgi:hypothetical protein
MPDDASAIEMQPPPQSLGITAFIQVSKSTEFVTLIHQRCLKS